MLWKSIAIYCHTFPQMVYPWWMFHMLVCWRLVVSLPFPSAWKISEVLEMCRNQSEKNSSPIPIVPFEAEPPQKNRNKW